MWQYQNTDELYHYKYIRRYKKNGKWRYVYDDSEYKRKSKEAENALNAANRIGKKGFVNNEGYYETSKYSKYGVGESSRRSTSKKRTPIDAAKENAQNVYLDTWTKHQIQKIKDIPKRIYSRGLSFTSAILEKIDDKKRNKKKKQII